MNNASVTRKVRFHLIATLMILLGLFSNLHLISAQSANVIQADQYAGFSEIHSISIGPDGFVTSIQGDSDYRPIRMVAPQYPTRAQQRGITGWNLVSFSVNEDGNVDEDSIVVVDSEPAGIFDRESIRAAAQFEFRPATAYVPGAVNGTKVGVDGIQFLFRYELDVRTLRGLEPNLVNREYLPLNYITPQYPLAASEENVEGYVLVEFTVTDQGMPAGIVILDRSPSGIFNASAINAAERFRFQPRLVDGVPMEVPGVRYTFRYELNDD